ncbi:MAG: hypothetical protein H7331_07780 [Bacteroidia bacterium]|jgi:hypothetical protein|nr:hypothetical protein [Bacteroidia bacterium]
MKTNNLNLSDDQIKILQAMKKVRANLIAFKKRMGTDLVTMQGDKIVFIKAADL